MSLAVDLILLAVVVLFVLIGMKRGFISEVVSLVSFVVAFLVAFNLSSTVSSAVYDGIVEERIVTKVSESVLPSLEIGSESGLTLPESVVDAGEYIGIDVYSVIDTAFGDSFEETAEHIGKTVSDKVAGPILTSFIRALLFIVIFIILKIVLDFLAKFFKIVSRLPVIGGANKLLGGVIGAVRGVLAAVVLCYALTLVVKFRPGGFLGITRETVESSVLFEMLGNILK